MKKMTRKGITMSLCKVRNQGPRSLSQLPIEVIHHITTYVPLSDLNAWMCTCKAQEQIFQEEYICENIRMWVHVLLSSLYIVYIHSIGKTMYNNMSAMYASLFTPNPPMRVKGKAQWRNAFMAAALKLRYVLQLYIYIYIYI